MTLDVKALLNSYIPSQRNAVGLYIFRKDYLKKGNGEDCIYRNVLVFKEILFDQEQIVENDSLIGR